MLCEFLDPENWWRWVWGDLRRHRPSDQRICGPQARVSQASQAGPEDGGGSPQKAAG